MKASILVLVLSASACSEQKAIPGGSTVGPAGADGLAGRDGAPGAAGVAGAAGRDGAGNIEGSRLKHVYWVGSDSSKTFDHVEDSKYSTRCVTTIVTGVARCAFPSSTTVSDLQYSNAGCTAALLVSDPAPDAGVAFSGKFWSVGAASTASTRYYGTPASCMQVPLPTGTAYDATEVPFTDFVSLTKGAQ